MPVTVLVAARNEVLNLPRCLASVGRAQRSIVLDSNSADGTQGVARMHGAELVQFHYRGGYPKKRQWALDSLAIGTPWILLLDADEAVPEPLWNEIGRAITQADAPDAFLITKSFHFLGRRMRHGGFSHAAVLLFRKGTARFERLFDDDSGGLDMEIHERVMVVGRIARLHTPLIHEDVKGLESYISRHNAYSTWEARLRYRYITQGRYGEETISPRLFGNSQERRRYLKALVIRLPFEPWLWFFYHYIARLGFLEGRAGLIASQIRASYIAQVRAKMFELKSRTVQLHASVNRVKLIFVNRYFDPDTSATSQILSDLAFHLATLGSDVHVVTSRQLYDDPAANLPSTENIRGVAVHRVRTSRFGRTALAGRAIDYASFHVTAASRLIRLARPNDIIIANTDPPLVSVMAAAAARIRGARLVNWVQDLFPEVAERLGMLRRDGATAGVLRRARDIALRQAAANVAIGTRMAQRLEVVGSGKVRIIGNWTHDDALRPATAAQNRLRRDWGLEGRFIVGYSGNLGRAHECETLLGAAERLRGQSDIVFLFIGGGHQVEALKAAFAERKLASLRVRPYQPRAALGSVLSLPDVHWVSLRPALEGLIVPSKFYGICAVGRPVIMVGDREGEIGSIVRNAGCGMAVARGDDAGFASAILRLRNDPALRDAMGGRARRLLDDRFSRSRALGLWQDLIGELAPPPSLPEGADARDAREPTRPPDGLPTGWACRPGRLRRWPGGS